MSATERKKGKKSATVPKTLLVRAGGDENLEGERITFGAVSMSAQTVRKILLRRDLLLFQRKHDPELVTIHYDDREILFYGDSRVFDAHLDMDIAVVLDKDPTPRLDPVTDGGAMMVVMTDGIAWEFLPDKYADQCYTEHVSYDLIEQCQ